MIRMSNYYYNSDIESMVKVFIHNTTYNHGRRQLQ